MALTESPYPYNLSFSVYPGDTVAVGLAAEGAPAAVADVSK